MHVLMAFRLERILGIVKAARDGARLDLSLSLAGQRGCEERILNIEKKADETSSDLDNLFSTDKSSSIDRLNLHALQRNRLDSILFVMAELAGEHEKLIKNSAEALTRYQEAERRESAISRMKEKHKNKLVGTIEKKEEAAADDNGSHGKECF